MGYSVFPNRSFPGQEATLPAIGNVEAGVQYGIGGDEFTGTFIEPGIENVKYLIKYGANGTEFTGTFGIPQTEITYPGEGKAQNIKASLEKYIRDNIVLIEGLYVVFEGFPWSSTAQEEWIHENILTLRSNSQYHRQVGENTYGETLEIILDFSIFVNKEKTRKTNRHQELRDIIANYFKVGTEINLYDFASADFNTVLQKLKVHEIITDEVIPNNNYLQYNYTASILWLNKW